MDLVLDLIATLSRWSRHHLFDISLAVMATLFVLFGFHADYDPLFEDLRHQLHGTPGEPVDLDRFLREE